MLKDMIYNFLSFLPIIIQTCNQIATLDPSLLIHIPVHSFIDLVKYLFTVPGVKAFLKNRICQNPLERQHFSRFIIHDNRDVVYIIMIPYL